MRQAQPIGVADSEVSTMLWPNAQIELSSSLIATSFMIQRGVFEYSAVVRNQFEFTTQTNSRNVDLPSGPARVTPLVLNGIGELVNETKIVARNREGSAGFSIEGHTPEKDGIPSGWLATEAFTTGGAGLSGKVAAAAVEAGIYGKIRVS